MVGERKHPESELISSLRRAFVERKADFIIADGFALRDQFLRESLQLGLNRGWLCQGKSIDEDRALGAGRGQYSALTYRLTTEGRKYFL